MIKTFELTGKDPVEVVNSVRAMKEKWQKEMQEKYGRTIKVVFNSSRYMANEERATYGVTVLADIREEVDDSRSI